MTGSACAVEIGQAERTYVAANGHRHLRTMRGDGAPAWAATAAAYTFKLG